MSQAEEEEEDHTDAMLETNRARDISSTTRRLLDVIMAIKPRFAVRQKRETTRRRTGKRKHS